MVLVVLEGGGSDPERLEVDETEPPLHLDRGGERYAQVLSHFDQHLPDISGRWRYRIVVQHQAMPLAHAAIMVKP